MKKKEKSKAPAGDFSVAETGALLIPFIFTVIAIIIQGSLRDGVTTWMPSYISETFSLGSDISILSGVIMPVFAFLCIWATEYLYYKIKSVQKCCFMYFSVSFTLLSKRAVILNGSSWHFILTVCIPVLNFNL